MSTPPAPGGVRGLAMVGIAGPELAPAEAALLRRLDVAGVILFRRNVRDAEQLTRLCSELQTCRAVDALPLLICADQEGGSVSPLAAALGLPPGALALGLADDPALTRRVHAVTARRAAACGVRWLLAPVADVVAGENPVVATRAFGAEPQRVAAHVAAAIAGLRDGGVLSCVKHWPGHGRPTLDSHVAVPTLDVDVAEWECTELPPFAAAVQAGVPSVMAAHLLAPRLDPSGVVASRSAVLLGQQLREGLGFSGVIVSDALEMAGFRQGRPEQALVAGIDLLLYAAPVGQAAPQLEAFAAALEARAIPTATLEGACARVAALRRAAVTIGRDAPTAAAPEVGDDIRRDVSYEQARERGIFIPSAVLRHAPRPWAGGAGSGERWVLLDAASADRLLRAEPDAGLIPLPPPASSVLEPPLRAALGAPRTVAVLRSPADPALEASEIAAALHATPANAGLVLASLRPLQGPLGAALEANLQRLRPAWIALLGDLSLVRRASRALPGTPLVGVPGAAAEDARVMGSWLVSSGPGSTSQPD